MNGFLLAALAALPAPAFAADATSGGTRQPLNLTAIGISSWPPPWSSPGGRRSAARPGGDGPDIQPSPGFTRVAMTAKMALRDIASARSCIAESSRIVAFTDT
jgi:hypothetical protein